jgi:hypothetical protein
MNFSNYHTFGWPGRRHHLFRWLPSRAGPIVQPGSTSVTAVFHPVPSFDWDLLAVKLCPVHEPAHLSPCPEIVRSVLVEQRALHTSRAFPAAPCLAAVIGPGTATSCSEDRLAAKRTDQKGFSIANAAQTRVLSPARARVRKQITRALAFARTVNDDRERGAKRSECSMNRRLCGWRPDKSQLVRVRGEIAVSTSAGGKRKPYRLMFLTAGS